MQSLQGQLLVASPHLTHSDFARTVILMLHHGEDGAVGVVLNRPSGETIQSFWSKLSRQPCPIEKKVNLGGPVAGPVMVLQHLEGGEKRQADSEIAVSAAPAELGGLLQNAGDRLRVFIGHAQWDSGRLEGELQAGAWLVTSATVDLVFGDDDQLWPNAVRQVGREFLSSVLSIKHVSGDPTWN